MDPPQPTHSYDPEDDSFSYATKTKNLAKLDAFARELAERVSIPSAVRALASSGSAYLRFNRDAGKWSVATVRGDPYFRAILYEAASNLSATSHALFLLSETDYRSVRIYLDFSTVSALDETAKPLVTSTNANKVFIDITYKKVDAKWQLAMPIDNEQGDDSVAPNIVGIGSFLFDALKDFNPKEDVDVKRLRTSPAFVRPLDK